MFLAAAASKPTYHTVRSTSDGKRQEPLNTMPKNTVTVHSVKCAFRLGALLHPGRYHRILHLRAI